MKKAIQILSFSLFVVLSASGAKANPRKTVQKKQVADNGNYSREYGMAGCGLGSVIVGKKGNQIIAATTNATAYNQSFAITVGTANCDDSEMTQTASRMDHFVAGNQVALAADVARGGGETLTGVSKILSCSNTELLNRTLQGKFSEIFPNYEVTPNEITDSVITVIRKDSVLAGTCSFLNV